MLEAVFKQLPQLRDKSWFDAMKIANNYSSRQSLIKGDSKAYLIAAASIVAKSWHFVDRMDEANMIFLYPGYGFAQNAGLERKLI